MSEFPSDELYPYQGSNIDARLDAQINETPEQYAERVSLLHSAEYFHALGIDTKEKFSELERMNAPLQMGFPGAKDYYDIAPITVEAEMDGHREDFRLLATNRRIHYEAVDQYEHTRMIMAIALNPELNTSSGQGNLFFNTVPREWHLKILDALQTKKQFNSAAEALFNAPVTPETKNNRLDALIKQIRSFINKGGN